MSLRNEFQLNNQNAKIYLLYIVLLIYVSNVYQQQHYNLSMHLYPYLNVEFN